MADEQQTTGDKKQRIMEVAAHLFTQRGFDGVSVREIAERAQVTKPVIYYYFENKEDLYQQLLEQAFARMARLHDEIYHADLDIREKLRKLVKGHFRFCQEDPDLVKLVFDAMRDRIGDKAFDPKGDQITGREKFRRISAFIREGQNQQVFRRDIDPFKVGMMFIGTTNMFVLYQLHSDREVISDTVADELVEIILHGIESSEHAHQMQREDT